MSHIGIPGAIGLSSKEDDKYTPYDLGWNAAFNNFHPIVGLTLEDLKSRGWIDGYLAYIREQLNTERIELRIESERSLERQQKSS